MIRHVAGIAEIVVDVEAAVHFYADVVGLAVEYDAGSSYATIEIPGVLHFGLWERAAAAESVYGTAELAHKIPLGFSLGFEVDEVATSEKELIGKGLAFIQSRHEEPWGQVTSRFHSPSGALCEISETPWARDLPA